MGTTTVDVHSIYLVTLPEAFHILTDGFNLPGYYGSQDWLLESSKTQLDSVGDPERERDIETSNSAVPYVHCCREYLDKDLIVLGSRFLYLLELKDFR
jgi:hypothetical protein